MCFDIDLDIPLDGINRGSPVFLVRDAAFNSNVCVFYPEIM